MRTYLQEKEMPSQVCVRVCVCIRACVRACVRVYFHVHALSHSMFQLCTHLQNESIRRLR